MFQKVDLIFMAQINVLPILDRGVYLFLLYIQMKDICSLAFLPTGQVAVGLVVKWSTVSSVFNSITLFQTHQGTYSKYT